MAKRGKIDSEITARLSRLQERYKNHSPDSIFQENTDTFLDSFERELNDSIQDILKEFPELSKKEIRQQALNTFNITRDFLITIYIQEAMYEITFPAYPLLKFIEAFSGLIDEVEFIITEKYVVVNAMDPSRICLLQLKLNDESYKFTTIFHLA